jgi:APA family basic amino acid/polyamine antiporter
MDSLKRSIGLVQATAIVAGTMIGASIFVQPSEIARHAPTVTGTLLAWALAGVLTLFGALVCAQLARIFPHTGGVYVFLRDTFSPALGFLWGWAMFWSMHTGIIAATATIFARYAAFFVPLSDTGIRAVAVAAVALISAINFLGVRQGSALQTAVTVAKVLGIASILGLVLVARPSAPFRSVEPGALSFSGLLLAVSAGLFAFGGWHMVTYTAGETRDPERTIPRALLLGTLLVTVCYFGLNAAYLSVLPVSQVVASTRVAADTAEVLMGPRAAGAVSALVMISVVGVLNGVILAGPRVYLAMAEDGLLFRWMGAVHPRFRTPHVALLLQAVLAAALVATGTYRALFTRVIYTEWLFFALLAIGLVRLPQMAGRRGFAALALVFAAASLAIVVQHIIADPVECASGLALVLLGLPLYFYWKRGTRNAGD